MKELRGSAVVSDIDKYRAEVDRKYSMVKRAVFDEYPHDLPSWAFSRSNYEWAHAIMDSRSIW